MHRGISRVGTPVLSALITLAGVAFAESPGEGIYRGWSRAVQFDTSPPLRSMPPLPAAGEAKNLIDPETHHTALRGEVDEVDPVVQGWRATDEIPAPLVSFDGPLNYVGAVPPDPVGDVGPDHYVAMSNLYFQIYDKSGTSVYGPAANKTLWSGFGGPCQVRNDGDPIVIYDQLADRWILTQFTAGSVPYYNCVAISTSSDPTGTYYRYAFSTGDYFPDYPKYGVWTDAYYISTREIEDPFGNPIFRGVGAYAVNRAEMIAGNPSPTVIEFLVSPAGNLRTIGDGLLPADLDGNAPPPEGSPNYFVGTIDDGAGYGASADAVNLWQFHADFDTPANSSFTLTDTIEVADFDSIFPCTPAGSRKCIPQPDTAIKIDILSYRQRPLHRLAYRNFGSHESLVTNQSVEATTGIAGIRWYEIRSPGSSPVIHQQGTYAPGATDGIHRWMGSVAMDNGGNLALGYSASDGIGTYPSVWYSGRLANDPPGTMPRGEGSIIDGTGSQTENNYPRWGDYTSMNVDPTDDCTFWYINEYYPVTSQRNWRLRVGAFRFDECVPMSPPLFMDGFEAGDTDAWSNVVP